MKGRKEERREGEREEWRNDRKGGREVNVRG